MRRLRLKNYDWNRSVVISYVIAKKKAIRKGCLLSCGSGLETKLRFVGKLHCVCLPLHAADAPLGNNIALLAQLRSLRSLQVLLSAPKKSNPKGLPFLCDGMMCEGRKPREIQKQCN